MTSISQKWGVKYRMAEGVNPLAGRAYLYEITFEHPPGTCPTDIKFMVRDVVASDKSGAKAQAEAEKPVCEVCQRMYIIGTIVRRS